MLLLGGAFYAIDRYSVRLYYEELSQRLNASLAMYVVNAGPLISNGEIDRQALDELSNRAMVINPTAEIYLVKPDGEGRSQMTRPKSPACDRFTTARFSSSMTSSAS